GCVVVVRGAGRNLEVRPDGGTAVGAEGPPELGIIVGDAVCVPRSRTTVVAGVVPGHRDEAGRLVDSQVWQKLAVGAGVVVHSKSGRPVGAVVVRRAHDDEIGRAHV